MAGAWDLCPWVMVLEVMLADAWLVGALAEAEKMRDGDIRSKAEQKSLV